MLFFRDSSAVNRVKITHLERDLDAQKYKEQ